ncbi:MAG: hypothetical protein WBZ36_25125 [Candidatus Nitrosopolaris sp.]
MFTEGKPKLSSPRKYRASTVLIDVNLKKDLRYIALSKNSNFSAEVSEACRRYVLEYKNELVKK